ncbi:nucleoside hydrolase [Pseudoalteromonas piscicida]|uniref:nucleoside hydrolase n=1 Tax=Pseudoalteromonas piscicida TaxID=43662 RepID=UPI001CB80D65|nr:nucleoside hydrolase [Pseudoalteromonas piscicida]
MSKLTKVIIDTDMDFDDYMALAYLLQHPQIEVLAISVTGCGAAHLSKGVENLANFLTLYSDETQKLPILKGANAPLRYSNVFPATVRQGADSHYQATFPQKNTQANIYEAQAWLTDYFSSTSDKVTVLSIGGGTNFGQLLQTAKTDKQLQTGIFNAIEQIVMMGGNLTDEYITPGAGGNILDTLGDNPYYSNAVAEWNIFIDPLGAEEVIGSGLPVTLVSLNATSDVPIDSDFVTKLKHIQSPQAQFLSEVLDYPDNKEGIGSFLSFWDPLAACVITNPDIVSTQSFAIRIEQAMNEEQDTSGKLIVDEVEGTKISVAISANKSLVYETYLAVFTA